MKLLTWNLWWRFGENWQDRQSSIGTELQRVDADICGFQEVFCVDGEDQLDLLKHATGLDGVGTERCDGRARFGNALLSRFPLANVDQITLPGPDGEPGHRSAIIADIDTPTGSLAVAVTHLEWRYDASLHRQHQLVPVLAELARRQQAGRVPVLLADLNAVPGSDEVRRLTGLAPPIGSGAESLVLTDSWAAVGDGPGFTWERENSNSVDAAFPRRRLDYVMVGWPRPKPTFNPLSAELVGTSRDAVGGHPSDHYGVVVTVDDREPFEDSAS